MFHCPVGVWVIEQCALILSATVRSPTVFTQGPQTKVYRLLLPVRIESNIFALFADATFSGGLDAFYICWKNSLSS